MLFINMLRNISENLQSGVITIQGYIDTSCQGLAKTGHSRMAEIGPHKHQTDACSLYFSEVLIQILLRFRDTGLCRTAQAACQWPRTGMASGRQAAHDRRGTINRYSNLPVDPAA